MISTQEKRHKKHWHDDDDWLYKRNTIKTNCNIKHKRLTFAAMVFIVKHTNVQTFKQNSNGHTQPTPTCPYHHQPLATRLCLKALCDCPNQCYHMND